MHHQVLQDAGGLRAEDELLYGATVPPGALWDGLYIDDHILIAVLYINGEPLMYTDLYKAIKFASDRKVATLISTNGELLTEKNIQKIVPSVTVLKARSSTFES